MAKPTPCVVCGEMCRSAKAEPAHPRCRPTHGLSGYNKRGCRCAVCREAHAAKMRRYTAVVKERDGVSPTQKYRPAKRSPCVQCGVPMKRRKVRCESCAERHKAAVRRRREARRRLDLAAEGVVGSASPWVCGTCAECGEGFVRKNGASPYCSKRCSAKEARRRRRARKRDAFVARVSRREVFERDRWMCGICGKATRRQAKVPHDLAPVIDHIIPLNKGGTHEPKNVQCAHFLCNSIKRDNAAHDQLLLFG